MYRGIAQSGSASALGAECRRFESFYPDQTTERFLSGQRDRTVNATRKFRWFESTPLHQYRNDMYEYKVEIDRVVDGDTVDVVIDLGFQIYINERVRLEGIDAPEVRTRDWVEKEKGFVSMEWLQDRFIDAEDAGVPIILRTTKYDPRGKFGRCIGTLYINEVNINEEMLDKGLAEEYVK
jgi:endonuclease YncB( thermonuclease family)